MGEIKGGGHYEWLQRSVTRAQESEENTSLHGGALDSLIKSSATWACRLGRSLVEWKGPPHPCWARDPRPWVSAPISPCSPRTTPRRTDPKNPGVFVGVTAFCSHPLREACLGLSGLSWGQSPDNVVWAFLSLKRSSQIPRTPKTVHFRKWMGWGCQSLECKWTWQWPQMITKAKLMTPPTPSFPDAWRAAPEPERTARYRASPCSPPWLSNSSVLHCFQDLQCIILFAEPAVTIPELKKVSSKFKRTFNWISPPETVP